MLRFRKCLSALLVITLLYAVLSSSLQAILIRKVITKRTTRDHGTQEIVYYHDIHTGNKARALVQARALTQHYQAIKHPHKIMLIEIVPRHLFSVYQELYKLVLLFEACPRHCIPQQQIIHPLCTVSKHPMSPLEDMVLYQCLHHTWHDTSVQAIDTRGFFLAALDLITGITQLPTHTSSITFGYYRQLISTINRVPLTHDLFFTLFYQFLKKLLNQVDQISSITRNNRNKILLKNYRKSLQHCLLILTNVDTICRSYGQKYHHKKLMTLLYQEAFDTYRQKGEIFDPFEQLTSAFITTESLGFLLDITLLATLLSLSSSTKNYQAHVIVGASHAEEVEAYLAREGFEHIQDTGIILADNTRVHSITHAAQKIQKKSGTPQTLASLCKPLSPRDIQLQEIKS